MTRRFHALLVALILGIALLMMCPDAAYAYGGPGSVISGIGTLLAALAAIVASLFGFIWFPLKRLYARMTEDSTEEEEVA